MNSDKVKRQSVTGTITDNPGDEIFNSDLLSNQEGTVGFNSNLAGRGKAFHSRTSSFGAKSYAKEAVLNTGNEVVIGQEEGGRQRQPNTGIVGRADLLHNRNANSMHEAVEKLNETKKLEIPDE